MNIGMLKVLVIMPHSRKLMDFHQVFTSNWSGVGYITNQSFMDNESSTSTSKIIINYITKNSYKKTREDIFVQKVLL